jgi:ribosomal protein L7Ae-like RNA K-turn-binding protein
MATEVAIKKHKACLVILACDLADSTRETVERLCRNHNVPWFNYADRNHLGHIVGREARAVLAVTSQGFADSIKKLQPNGE